MTQEIHIRPVAGHEINELRNIGESTFRETFEAQNTPENLASYLSKSFALEVVQKEYDDPSCDFYFAVVHDEILGYLKLNLTADDVEIERIYVKSNAQGLGVGKALFLFAKEVSQTRKANSLWLGVWQENKKAIEFYKRQGLEVFDIRQFKLGSDLQDDFLMRIKTN